MKNMFKAITLLLFTLASIAMQAQTAELPSGAGTSEDPYKVETLNNLYWITQNSSSWNKYFVQTADINASSTSGWQGGAGFLPIGSSAVPFTGTYNGQGGTISGLTINRPFASFVGLFGLVIDGTVKNVGMVSASINAYYFVGGIAGFVLNESSIESCYSSGTVTAFAYAGGIAGAMQDGPNLARCGTVASVSGLKYIGGLTGKNEATINECYAAGSVTGTGFTGGFAGQNSGTITNSFWDTQTSGQNTSAGGTGRTTAEMKNLATYTDLASQGLDDPWDFISTPNDDDETLDLWNMDEALIVNSGYPLPSWWPIVTQPSGSGTQIAPYQVASINNLYWLMQQNGWGANIFYSQTADIPTYSTRYINFGKGFKPIGNETNKFDGSFDGQNYLIADLYINRIAESYVGLFGLKRFGYLKNIHLVNADITGYRKVGSLAGLIGDVSFISNCSSSEVNLKFYYDGAGGLFGEITNDNVIDIVISGCFTTGDITQTIPHYTSNAGGYGGLAGYVFTSYYASFSLTKSYSTCSVTLFNSNSYYTGGLIGITNSASLGTLTIADCYATGDITSTNSVGGLIGDTYDEQTAHYKNCYSTGQVTGTSWIGGLVGHVQYSNSIFTSCFWDTETSGQASSAAGNGKTTAEMKTDTTFINAGWDFEEMWEMDAALNSGYPHLLYYYVPEVVTGEIVNIAPPTAECDGTVVAEGESAVTVRGLVWDTQVSPNLANNLGFTENGSGLGTFTGTLTGLQEGYTYYVRAYATNSYGTGYGDVQSFFIDFTPPGNGLYFNGLNQYVSLPDESAFDFVLAMTIEYWMRADDFDKAWQAIITKGDNAWRIQRQDQTDKITFATTHGGTPNSLTSNTSINFGEWYHVAAVFNGTTKYLYINGQLDNSIASSPIQLSNALVYIGENAESTGRYFEGIIDEVRIWNIARSAPEIAGNMYDTLSGSESGLVAYYRFDTVSGSLLPDLTAGIHHGTLVNMADTNWVPSGWGPPETATWTGAIDRGWNKAGNWLGVKGAPAPNQHVVIPAKANQPILNTTAEISSIEIQNGAVLTLSQPGILTITGTINNPEGRRGIVIKHKKFSKNRFQR